MADHVVKSRDFVSLFLIFKNYTYNDCQRGIIIAKMKFSMKKDVTGEHLLSRDTFANHF